MRIQDKHHPQTPEGTNMQQEEVDRIARTLLDGLEDVARSGPHKHERTNRRIRGFLNNRCIFDTLEAQFVWEHPRYPNFYIPLSAILSGQGDVSFSPDMEDIDNQSLIHVGLVAVPGERPAAVAALINQGPLKGFVKILFNTLDKWMAEDEVLPPSHPRDPYKRIECLPSSRTVRVVFEGLVIAESSKNNIFLHETGLRTRYYIPISSVRNLGWLRKSDTVTVCPYKGTAGYYDLEVSLGGRAGGVKDAVWYYDEPLDEVAAIKGKICFYNEKFDIEIDGSSEAA
ncbi:protein of unknown function (DUF427) domain containing protein [Rhypophila sp. PSN 637]